MQDTTWIATIAGLALGIGIILAFVIFKKNESGAAYVYDEKNRLQSIVPTMDAKRVTLMEA